MSRPMRWVVDAARDTLFGDRRGDELPPDLPMPAVSSKKARLATCREKLATKAAATASRDLN